FDRLKRVGRKTLGVEMEAFAIGHVGDALPQRAIVAKAVSDHADHDKDDRFRDFACHASAAWLLAFLKKHLKSRRAEPATYNAPAPSDPWPRSPFADLLAGHFIDLVMEYDEPNVAEGELLRGRVRGVYGVTELHQRVGRALSLRHPDRQATWKRAPDHVS